MGVKNFVPTSNITLVDGVLTLGRTTIAVASRIADKFPNANVRVFSLRKTMGFVTAIEEIAYVQVGTISYNHTTP